MAKTPDRPQYPTMDDTPWITRNRDLNVYAYDLYNDALANLNRYDNNALQSVADAYTQAQWNDLNRGYQQAVNQNIARQQNRLGTTGSTSGLYTTDDINRQYNDLASRVAAQTASQYQNLINNEFNRRLGTAQLYGNTFNTSGKVTQDQDLMNYQIGLRNMENKWYDDVQDSNWLGNTLSGIVSGAATGLATGGPVGGIVGGVLGGAGGALGGGQNQSMQSITSSMNNLYNNTNNAYPTTYGNYYGTTNNLSNYGLSQNALTNNIGNISFDDWRQGW